jgi:hypothetical protein
MFEVVFSALSAKAKRQTFLVLRPPGQTFALFFASKRSSQGFLILTFGSILTPVLSHFFYRDIYSLSACFFTIAN